MRTIAHTKKKLTTLRNPNYVGKLTFTEVRCPARGIPGIVIRTNDTRLRQYFPGRTISGETALLGIVLGQYRVLDLEVPSQINTSLN